MASVPHRFQTLAPLGEWWRGKSARERVIFAVLAITAAALALWVALWQPLVHDVATLRSARANEVTAIEEGRRMAEEIAALAKEPPPAAPADDRADLERVLASHGLRGATTQIGWQEGRAQLVFGAVGYGALIGVLEALQREARLRVIEATLTARVEPGTVRAELTLAR